MSNRRPQNTIDDTPNPRFWISLVATFLVTATYPVAVLATLPADTAFKYIRNEVAWSFHAVFLIPIAVGLLATIFDLRFFLQLAFWKRCAWVVVYVVPVVLLFFSVIADKQVIPTPDRVSPANGLQDYSIRVDQCLRNSACKDAAGYLAFVPKCRETYGTKFRALNMGAGRFGATDAEPTTGVVKRQAYFCALLEKTGGQPVPGNIVASLIFVLKYALIIFVWSFIYYTLFLAMNYFFETDKKALYALLGCYIIFISWFPCQLYAEWYGWYGDLTHIIYLYDAFWALLFLAFLLLLLFTAWTVVLVKKANPVTVVAAVHSVIIAVFAIVFSIKPATIDAVFETIRTLNNSILLVVMFIFVFYIVAYIKIIMAAGTEEGEPAESVRRRAAGRTH